MPYCQECGSHMEQDVNTCSSCGNKLIDVEPTDGSLSKVAPEVNQSEADGNTGSALETSGNNQATAGVPEETFKEPEQLVRGLESNINSVFKENPISQEGTIGSHWNQIESHLGKGLIKPVVIENSMDGFHFKYDEPPRQITKPEPQKEKMVEFRFSGEETGLSDESNEVKGINEAEKVMEEVPAPTEEGLEKDEPEAIPEPIPEPELKIESDREAVNLNEAEPDEAMPVEEVSLAENELLPEPEGVEPEIRLDTEPEIQSNPEPEILWEGHRSWNGLTLKELYRITERAVALLGGDGQKLREIEWKSVSKIDLKQNWLTKLLNIGSLEMIGSNSELLLILEGIEHPEELQKTLVEIIGSKV